MRWKVFWNRYICNRHYRYPRIVRMLVVLFSVWVLLGVVSFVRSPEMHKHQQSHYSLATRTPTICQEQRSFVYIKMIKCASSTLADVFRRFGLTRNLSFVLPPVKKIYIGWPYPIDDSFYRPQKGVDKFNILCEHAVYNATVLKSLMSPDTVYITSIREPFSQVKSMLNYYNVFNLSGVPVSSADPLSEYLNNLEHYETAYKSRAAAPLRFCIPDGFSMTRNLMSYNLGFPTGGFRSISDDRANDDALVQEWIVSLNSQFRLVMVVEYFDESVVLLRRLLCWQLQDILYSASNKLSYEHRSNKDPKLIEVYKQWSRVDFALYDYFNKTFWTRVAEQGLDFFEEVAHYRVVNNGVNDFCKSDRPKNGEHYIVRESQWNDEFDVSQSFCNQLLNSGYPQLSQLHDAYDKLLPLNLAEKPQSKPTC